MSTCLMATVAVLPRFGSHYLPDMRFSNPVPLRQVPVPILIGAAVVSSVTVITAAASQIQSGIKSACGRKQKLHGQLSDFEGFNDQARPRL